ncbi:MAG TPA: PQQ-binding-like beta-propeller repeat protein [Polyangiales bacterium]|nr:PQQ-binding-like beta-propeller repeat protein [Polyangiales bacterium]
MKRVWLIAGLLFPAAALAVSTKSFVVDASAEFEKGTVEGAAIDSSGKVTRSVQTARTPLDGVSVAYASALGPDGAIYVGTGSEGAIYRVDDKGAKLYADTPAALVTSLVWAEGKLYAGTLPGGKIYAIEKQARELATVAADHVWALAYENKRLFAATGPEGKLFSIDPASGKSELLYDDAAEHLLSVAVAQGKVYVGTSNGARLVRVTDKKAELLWDFPGQEVTTFALGKDFIAIAANDFAAPPTPASDNKDLGTAARAKRVKPGTGVLFTLGYDGTLRELARFDNAHISALELVADGIQVGLGHEGRIVRVRPNGERALWADVEERAIAALHLSGSQPFFVSSDGVSVYRVKDAGATGTWTSAVLDARAPARFGELQGRGVGTITWATRSGNSETADSSWSAWNDTTGPIKSPGARFLQLRAKLAGDAELYAVEAYYLPQNQAARIRSVRAKLPAQADDKPRNSTLTLSWEIDNPDEDKLRYRPFVKREGQSAWLPVLREFELLDHADYVWETRNLPDGWYRAKVVVSDEANNPVAYAQSAEAISAPILVDNHAPELELVREQGRLRGRARDAWGPIAQLEVAFDNGLFQPLFPDDDLLDSRDEAFHVELPAGARVIAVRAQDASRNSVSESVEVSVPTR